MWTDFNVIFVFCMPTLLQFYKKTVDLLLLGVILYPVLMVGSILSVNSNGTEK